MVSQTTETTDGVDLSEVFIVDNNLAAVMTESFGMCEQDAGQTLVAAEAAIAEQAAAQQAWKGDPSNREAAQRAFHHRAKMNSVARFGKYSPDLERAA